MSKFKKLVGNSRNWAVQWLFFEEQAIYQRFIAYICQFREYRSYKLKLFFKSIAQPTFWTIGQGEVLSKCRQIFELFQIVQR